MEISSTEWKNKDLGTISTRAGGQSRDLHGDRRRATLWPFLWPKHKGKGGRLQSLTARGGSRRPPLGLHWVSGLMDSKE